MIHKNVVLDSNSLYLFDFCFSISHLLTPLGCSLKLNLSAGGSNMKTMMMPMLILLGTAATAIEYCIIESCLEFGTCSEFLILHSTSLSMQERERLDKCLAFSLIAPLSFVKGLWGATMLNFRSTEVLLLPKQPQNGWLQ